MEVLRVGAFGFVAELAGGSCYFNEPYDVYLNGARCLSGDTNVFSVMGLKADTTYEVRVKRSTREDILFTVKTEKPAYVINVRDYNAVGDGAACDTAAINLAIYTAPRGAVVYFPAGEYVVDQVLLKTGVDLYLARGAVLRQSTDRKKLAVLKAYQKSYDFSDVRVNASWEGHPLDSFCALVYGHGVEDVHIYGEGVLDGSGDAGDFWENPKIKRTAFRPKNVLLAHCRNIEISGITSRNSASWNIHPFYSDNLHFRALKIESRADSPNTDGLNPESCENVEIVGCHFSVGDDCIAIKAGKYYMSTAHYKPARGIAIRNCLMEKGHGGVVIGSEMSCGVYDVRVTQCVFRETDRGLRIKTRRGRGALAVVDGIRFNNVRMDGVRHPFVVNMFYHCDPDGKSDYVRSKTVTEKDAYTPTVRNISVTNTHAVNITGSAVFIYGLPENPVENVAVTDNTFSFADETARVTECPAMMDDFEPVDKLGFYIENGTGVIFENNDIIGENVMIGFEREEI